MEATGTGFLVPIGVRVGAAFKAPAAGFVAGVAPELTTGVFFTGVDPLPAVGVLATPVAPGIGFLVPMGVLAGFAAAGAPVDDGIGVFLIGVALFFTTGVGFFAGVDVC